jgi:hypothetical protein
MNSSYGSLFYGWWSAVVMSLPISAGMPQQAGPIAAVGRDTDVASKTPDAAADSRINNSKDYSVPPPFDVDELWRKIGVLLNEHQGSVTKERFEDLFNVRFAPPERDSDATIYRLRQGVDWYFNARLTVYNERFNSAGMGAEINGAHIEWYVSWLDAFTHSSRGACIRANHARETLMASGWTSPWLRWGIWEEIRQRPADPGVNPLYPPPVLPGVASFFRQPDEDSGHRDRLPRGQLDTTGDLPDSCVTGILVTAKAPVHPD